MSVIQFTDADKLAGKTAEKGIYPVLISNIDGPKASASKKSVSYFVTYTVTAGPLMNKEFTPAYNTETNNMSVLGSMQFIPSRDLMKVQAAILGIPFDQVALNLDTDTLLNKSLDISVDVVSSEGNLVNTVMAYFPSGTGVKATQTPF
jgi:hypothetical protein